MKDVDEPPFMKPPPVLLDALSAEQRGAVNHLVRGASSSCPHRFDTASRMTMLISDFASAPAPTPG
jgi:hypothetical protein